MQEANIKVTQKYRDRRFRIFDSKPRELLPAEAVFFRLNIFAYRFYYSFSACPKSTGPMASLNKKFQTKIRLKLEKV